MYLIKIKCSTCIAFVAFGFASLGQNSRPSEANPKTGTTNLTNFKLKGKIYRNIFRMKKAKTVFVYHTNNVFV